MPNAEAAVTEPAYTYRALVRRVIDGDTVEADIDCGFHLVLRSRAIRLLGINTPELHGDRAVAGQAARSYLVELLERYGTPDEDGWRVIVATKLDRDDKYGRLLGTLWGRQPAALEKAVNINERMLAGGHAKAIAD